jgi:hypothetical protein
MTYFPMDVKHADLATEFGLNWATQLFGAEAIASLPVRKSGKNKGAPKGFVIWRKAVNGGYCRDLGHAVKAGGFIDAWIGAGFASNRSDAVQGRWLGRSQALAGSVGGYLFEQGRERADRERALAAARWEEEKADMLAEREGR